MSERQDEMAFLLSVHETQVAAHQRCARLTLELPLYANAGGMVAIVSSLANATSPMTDLWISLVLFLAGAISAGRAIRIYGHFMQHAVSEWTNAIRGVIEGTRKFADTVPRALTASTLEVTGKSEYIAGMCFVAGVVWPISRRFLH